MSPLGWRGLLFEFKCELEDDAGEAVDLGSTLFGRTPFSHLVLEGASSRSVGAAIEDFDGRKEVRGRRLLLAGVPFEISMTLDLRPPTAPIPGPSRLRGR